MLIERLFGRLSMIFFHFLLTLSRLNRSRFQSSRHFLSVRATLFLRCRGSRRHLRFILNIKWLVGSGHTFYIRPFFDNHSFKIRKRPVDKFFQRIVWGESHLFMPTDKHTLACIDVDTLAGLHGLQLECAQTTHLDLLLLLQSLLYLLKKEIHKRRGLTRLQPIMGSKRGSNGL